MRLAFPLILVALTAALVLPASPAYAQIELTEVDPPDGAQLDAPPEMVHICFSEPVMIKDPADFSFRYLVPDGRSLGLRIVFRPSGECVDVFPGIPDDSPEGRYTFEWQITAAEGGEEGSGTLYFQVGKGGTVVTPVPAGGDPGTVDSGDDGPDILLTALITTGVAGGVAVLFTLGYLVRRRIGYDPHRPPEGGEGDEGH